MARDSGLARPRQERTIAGRYRCEQLLGQGGMGAVYAAVDAVSGERIALKHIHPGAPPRALELFKREFQTLHGLRHPNIVEVFDYGSDESGPFYTMERLEGHDLGDAAPLPWRTVCSYLRQIASLLGLLHARRLLHRDISPRNIWVLPDGRLKLIDFGALTPFGPSSDVIGTPPFIAPEWLRKGDVPLHVDQRADLFALGALGYWLLTRAHAYAARSLSDLELAWSSQPAAPSSAAGQLEGRELDAIPAELDGLILSLLRQPREARPETTEIVIARLDAIAGPVSEPVEPMVRGYVRSSAFVGRSLERRWFEQQWKSAHRGAAILIEAASGLGRSRLLDELAVQARLSGATTLSVRGSESQRPYAAANAVALELLACLPQEARQAAAAHATALAQLSPELARALGVSAPPAEHDPACARGALEQALSAWLSALAEPRQLVLLVDDLQDCDSESAAWLASLARTSAGRRLVLVAALRKEPGRSERVEEHAYALVARVLELAPLTASQMHELLASVFGPSTAYLGRVSQSLHEASQGNPAHCLELVEHLVDSGLARYSEGSWTLPGQLLAADLPPSRSAMHLLRLGQLSGDARRLAELLSIHDGRVSRAACEALSELSATETAAALVELTLHGVLDESEHGYAFTHESLRAALSGALDGERRKRAHAQLGAALLAGASDEVEAMRAGLHLFEAGDHASCERLVREAVRQHFAGKRERMQASVPLIERALALYDREGWAPERLAAPLAGLATASFFVDRRLSDRHGVRALDVLEQVLRFDLARRLQPLLGGKLSLLAALARSGLARMGKAQHMPPVAELLRMLIGVAVALNGVAASSTDVALTDRCMRALEPLAALGDRSVPGFVRRCTLAVAALLRANHAAALQELETLFRMMESGPPIPKFPVHLKHEFMGGCLFSIGVMQGWRHDSQTLAIADRLQSFSPIHAMNADYLRASYHARMGEMDRAAAFRQRAETRALQLGAAWQVVTLAPIEAQFAALWTHDVRLAKYASAELERLSSQVPALRGEALRTRAQFLLLSGRYAEAAQLLEGDLGPRDGVGFARAQGLLARAYNRLGHHARARELCQAVVAGCSEAELSFVVMYLHAQVELALADAGLGELGSARARIAALLSRYASAGPLALGAIHETGLRIELLAEDLDGCKRQLAAVRELYLPRQISSLIDLTASLSDAVARLERRDVQVRSAELGADAHLVTRMQMVLTQSAGAFESRIQHAVELVLELAGAAHAMLLDRAEERAVCVGFAAPTPELLAWARAQLATDELDTAFMEDAVSAGAAIGFTLDDIKYWAFPLFSSEDSAAPAAALVLGFRGEQPRRVPPRVLSLLAEHLSAAQR